MRVFHLTWFILFTTGSASAQNSDLGIMFTGSWHTTVYNADPQYTYKLTNASIGLQANYAWQLFENAKGRLYVEAPVAIFSSNFGKNTSIQVSGNNFTYGFPQSPVIFFTPGVRYHYNVKPRVALYAAAGGGLALNREVIETGLIPQ